MLEGAGIVDIAMQRPWRCRVRRRRSFRGQQVEHDLGTRRIRAAFSDFCLFELDAFERGRPSLTFALALDRLGGGADMAVGHKIDAALGIGAAVDADLQASQCQMLVLQVEPAIALLQKLLLLAGPEAILDLARLARGPLPSSPVTATFFAPKPCLGERPQRRHQMDVRVAWFVVIDPVGDLPARQHLLDHELAHQRDVLLFR
jgi:hypothetical protein